jgi:ureidoacrylate peracid hydrolase
MASAPSISVPARPASVSLEPRQTAVIVVDMQNDFASEGGMFARAGIDTSGIRAAVGPVSRVVQAARSAGMRVVYLKMEFRPDLSDIGGPGSANAVKHRLLRVGESVTAPDGREGRVLVKGTWNTEIVDELKPTEGDIIISKQRFSGFYNTELDTILRTLGISSLIFTGCTTSVCVESTLRDAAFRDYECLLLADCTAEPIGADLVRSNYEATLLLTEMMFGAVSDSAAFLKAMEPQSVLTPT